tara:strand:+ start:404 stop:1408 length:1005 start_codon:yes stop_codon:yes gene_type:complete
MSTQTIPTCSLNLDTFKVKSKRWSKDHKNLSTIYGLNTSNFLTIGSNPKLEKSGKILDIPTAGLCLMPTTDSCPMRTAACAGLCLFSSGNPVHMPNKIKCRSRRYNAYSNLMTRPIFLRRLIIEVLRFYRKNDNKNLLAFRSNVVSDIAFETQPVTITDSDSLFILECFGINLNPSKYGSIYHALNSAYDYLKESFISERLRMYDYTKLANGLYGRNYETCKEVGLHLTLSYGGIEQFKQWEDLGIKENIFDHAKRYGLNIAAGWNSSEYGKEYPELLEILGKQYKVTTGDATDARFLDAAESMPIIIMLLIKRTIGQTEAMRKAFCINDLINS